jgi:predicted aspartyl protease
MDEGVLKRMNNLLKGLVFSLIVLQAYSVNSHAMESDIQLVRADSGHFLVPVNIHGYKTIFLIDTGATSSVLDAELLKKINRKHLTTRENVQGYTAGKTQDEFKQYTLNTLSIAGNEVSDITVVEQPIKAMLDGIYSSPVEGLLGHDALAQLGLSLQLKQAKLVNFDTVLQSTDKKEAYSAISIQMSKMGLPYISAHINQQSLGLIIDSGANDIMLDNHKAKALKFDKLVFPEGMTAMDQNGNARQLGLVENALVKISHNEIGTHVILDDFSQILEQVNQDSSVNIVGIIGLNALANFDAVIDIANNTLYLKK